ncbi:MAG: hypothetical protein IJT75_04280 [Bacteroidaceae bacterium]|nr:hypothetical protein [Bacteroidaceae bacterium]
MKDSSKATPQLGHPLAEGDSSEQQVPPVRLSRAEGDASEQQVQRATWHDYHAPGVYMLTLCCEGRRRVFGELDGKEGVHLTPLGSAVDESLRELPRLFPEMVVVRSVVMPDHVHAVVQVERPMEKHLGAVVRRLKYVTTVAYLRELDRLEGGTHRVLGSRPSRREREMMMSADIPQTTAHGKPGTEEPPTVHENGAGMVYGNGVDAPEKKNDNNGSGVPCAVSGGASAGSVPFSAGSVTFVPPLWQEGYHDRILKDWGQFPKMVRYVEDNPRRAWIKRQHPRLFHEKWTLDVPVEVSLARALYREARALAEVPSLERFLVVDRGKDPVQTSLRFRAMGNYFLISEATLLPLRVSRRATPGELLHLQTQFLTRCAIEGAVIVTPCVSSGEQTIADALLAAGHRVIRLQHEAMSMHYSPSARQLPYVASGQLLLLAPWPDQPLSQHPGKGRFELLNAVARVLCGLEPS